MAEANHISCPHCSQPYSVLPEQWEIYSGRTIHCARCGRPFVVMPSPAAPPAGAPVQINPFPYGFVGAPGYPGGPPPTNGWAVASLVAGILGVCLVPILSSLTAVITGIVGIARADRYRGSGRGMAVAGLVLGAIGLVAPLLLLPVLSVVREQANRVKCADNMKVLGRAMGAYANQHGGHFPARLEDVLEADPLLSPSLFVCPDDSRFPAGATTPQALAARIAAGQNCSYVYAGRGLTTSAGSDVVLLFEPLADHHEGMNVLFADGSVKWVARAAAQRIRQQHTTGVTPIRLPKDGLSDLAPARTEIPTTEGTDNPEKNAK